MPKWNLSDTVVRLSRLQAAVSIQLEVNQQCARFPPADFREAVAKNAFMLQNEDLSAAWHVPTFRQKCAPPAWVQQVLLLRNNPQALPDVVACVTQIELEKWTRMSSDDIRSIISRPGKHFIAAYTASAQAHGAICRACFSRKHQLTTLDCSHLEFHSYLLLL